MGRREWEGGSGRERRWVLHGQDMSSCPGTHVRGSQSCAHTYTDTPQDETRQNQPHQRHPLPPLLAPPVHRLVTRLRVCRPLPSRGPCCTAPPAVSPRASARSRCQCARPHMHHARVKPSTCTSPAWHHDVCALALSLPPGVLHALPPPRTCVRVRVLTGTRPWGLRCYKASTHMHEKGSTYMRRHVAKRACVATLVRARHYLCCNLASSGAICTLKRYKKAVEALQKGKLPCSCSACSCFNVCAARARSRTRVRRRTHASTHTLTCIPACANAGPLPYANPVSQPAAARRGQASSWRATSSNKPV